MVRCHFFSDFIKKATLHRPKYELLPKSNVCRVRYNNLYLFHFFKKNGISRELNVFRTISCHSLPILSFLPIHPKLDSRHGQY